MLIIENKAEQFHQIVVDQRSHETRFGQKPLRRLAVVFQHFHGDPFAPINAQQHVTELSFADTLPQFKLVGLYNPTSIAERL